MRSYSRISGRTSAPTTTSTPGRRARIASASCSSCDGSAYACRREIATISGSRAATASATRAASSARQRDRYAGGGPALAHRDHVARVDQRRGVMRGEVVERGALLAAKLEEVGRSVGGAQDHARPAPLEQHVRHDRGPVHDALDGSRLRSLRAERFLDPLALVVGGAQDLPGDHGAVVERDGHQVGERPADIDPHGMTHARAGRPAARGGSLALASCCAR